MYNHDLYTSYIQSRNNMLKTEGVIFEMVIQEDYTL